MDIKHDARSFWWGVDSGLTKPINLHCSVDVLEPDANSDREPGFPCRCSPLFVDGPERGELEFVRIEGADSGYYEEVMKSVRGYFESIIHGDSERKIPELKVMRAKRNGVLV